MTYDDYLIDNIKCLFQKMSVIPNCNKTNSDPSAADTILTNITLTQTELTFLFKVAEEGRHTKNKYSQDKYIHNIKKRGKTKQEIKSKNFFISSDEEDLIHPVTDSDESNELILLSDDEPNEVVLENKTTVSNEINIDKMGQTKVCKLCNIRSNSNDLNTLNIQKVILQLGSKNVFNTLIKLVGDDTVTFNEYQLYLDFVRKYLCVCKIDDVQNLFRAYKENEKSKLMFDVFIKPILENGTPHNLKFFMHGEIYSCIYPMMCACLINGDEDVFNYIYSCIKKQREKINVVSVLKVSIDSQIDNKYNTFEKDCIEKLSLKGLQIIHSNDPYNDIRYIYRLYDMLIKHIDDMSKSNDTNSSKNCDLKDNVVNKILEIFDWIMKFLNDSHKKKRLLMRFIDDINKIVTSTTDTILNNLITHVIKQYNKAYNFIDCIDCRTYSKLYTKVVRGIVKSLPDASSQKELDDYVDLVKDVITDVLHTVQINLSEANVYITCADVSVLLLRTSHGGKIHIEKNIIESILSDILTIYKIYIENEMITKAFGKMKIRKVNNETFFETDLFSLFDKHHMEITRSILKQFCQNDLSFIRIFMKSFDIDFITSFFIKQNNQDTNRIYPCTYCLTDCDTVLIKCNHPICKACIVNKIENEKYNFKCESCKVIKN